MTTLSDLTGHTLGQYHLLRLLGKGGMSAVYEAVQTNLDREVAVKVLSQQLAGDPETAQRFKLEARTAAGLEHPNIVPVHDYGTYEGISYVVMRLLTGGSLAQRLRVCQEGERPLPSMGEAAELLDQLADALDYAHSKGIIHRDIKPSNVMFDHNGTAYIVDFGIARLMNASAGLTREGMMIGTPLYMAPEQWRGEQVTPAADQYALGILMYNVLTGQLPFYDETPHALMYKHLNAVPAPPHQLRAEVPQAINLVIERALAKLPQQRYLTARALSETFTALVQGRDGTPTGFFTFPLPEDDSIRLATPGGVQQAQPLPIAPPGTPPELPLEPPASSPPLPGAALTIESTAPPLPEALPDPVPALSDTQERQRLPTQPGLPPAKADDTSPGLIQALPGDRDLRARNRGLAALLIVVAVLAGGLFLLILLAGRGDGSGAATDTPSGPDFTVQPPVGLTIIAPVVSGGGESGSGSASSAIASARTPITVQTAVQVQQAGTLLSQPDVPVRALAVSSQGAVASGHADSTVRLWRPGSPDPVLLEGHSGIVYAAAFSPDGSLLATAGDDTTIRLWNVATGSAGAVLRGHSATVRDLAFSPDGATLASAGQDYAARIWSVNSGITLFTLRHDARVLAVAFAPDGALLATGTEIGVVRLWSTQTGSAVRVITAHDESIRSLAYSPDGSLLATASTDNTIRLWDAARGDRVRTLQGHSYDVWRAVFSPDGALLASGGRDNTIRLWDAASGDELAVLEGHTGWVLGLGFAPDGSALYSAGGDGTVRLWQ